ncbi:MAG: uroporphyrinogen-III synthase [Bacillota bacterium]
MNASRPLEGLGIVITRPRAAAEPLARRLEREGARPFVFPALAIEALPPSPVLDAALALLAQSRLAIFVSANAVEHGLAHARRHGPWPKRVRVAAIGDATAQALRNSGFRDVISPPERHDSEALLALEPLKSVDGERVVIFRGQGGREALKETLEARGALVTYAECYRRMCPAADAAPLLQAWSRGEVQAVNVLSRETLENFMTLVGAQGEAMATRTTLVVPHEAVGAHPAARRFARMIVSHPGNDGLVKSLGALRIPT